MYIHGRKVILKISNPNLEQPYAVLSPNMFGSMVRLDFFLLELVRLVERHSKSWQHYRRSQLALVLMACLVYSKNECSLFKFLVANVLQRVILLFWRVSTLSVLSAWS